MSRVSIFLFAVVLSTAALGAKAESLDGAANVQADWRGPGAPGGPGRPGGPGFGHGPGGPGGPGFGHGPGGPGWGGDHGGGWGPGHGGPGWGPGQGPGWGAPPPPPPPPPPPSYGLPNGSYLNSCEQCNFDGRTLSCYCRDTRGYESGTSLDASCCRSPIDNVNGQLYCQQ